MNAARIIQAAIPGADEGLCDYIIWNRTPYPFAKLTARELYKAASRLQRATENGKILCDHCDNLTAPGEWMCTQCREAIERHTQREIT